MRAYADATCAMLKAAPQPSPAAQGDALSDAVRVPLDSLHADAAYLLGRLREGSMPYARVIEIIRERIDAAKAAIRARAAQGDALDAARLDWLDQNIFHREMDDWDAKYGHGKGYNMWVLFAPNGAHGSARTIIDAARASQEPVHGDDAARKQGGV